MLYKMNITRRLPAMLVRGREAPVSRVVVSSATTPPDYSGAGLSALKFAERLDRQSRLAFVLTRTRADGIGERVFDAREGLPVVPESRMVRVTTQGSVNGRDSNLLRDAVRFAFASVRLAGSTTWQLIRRRQRYDVVHCFSPNWLSFYSIVVAKLLGKQAILEATLIDREEPQVRPPRDILGIKHAARRYQYHLADRVVAISPALGRRIAAAGYADKLHVITRSVDLGRFQPASAQQRQQLRSELGLSSEGPILLFVGHIGERKGADLLIPILTRVVEKLHTAQLVIVGQVGATREHKELHACMLSEIERQGLEKNVHFAPRTGAIEHYMKAATLFLFPSRREGFGTVVVEAMACGVVPVALRIPEVTDHMITQGEDGIYIEAEDPDAFARAILHLLDDPARRERMAATGARTVRERFSTTTIDAAYARMYAQLEGAPSRGGGRSGGSSRKTDA